MLEQLSHISLSSRNLQNVIDFYINILGFKVSHKFINKKNNELYGLFIHCGKKTFIEFFKDNKKKLHTLLSKKDNVILTPHLGEFKRIFEYKLNKSKIFNCLVASKLINNPVVLKGNDTVVAFPDERVYVDYGASNSLATAGTGDMLCGLISGLIAQGYKIKESILSAILIQRIISQSKNKTIVEDFIDLIPQTLNLLKKNN